MTDLTTIVILVIAILFVLLFSGFRIYRNLITIKREFKGIYQIKQIRKVTQLESVGYWIFMAMVILQIFTFENFYVFGSIVIIVAIANELIIHYLYIKDYAIGLAIEKNTLIINKNKVARLNLEDLVELRHDRISKVFYLYFSTKEIVEIKRKEFNNDELIVFIKKLIELSKNKISIPGNLKTEFD